MVMPTSAQSPVQLLWSKPPSLPEYINSVAVSADGSVVVAGTFCHLYAPIPDPPPCAENAEFGTYYWDAQGNALWSPDTFNGYQGVYWVAVSRDGSTIASGGWYSAPEPPKPPKPAKPPLGFVRAYDVASKTRTLMNNTLPGRTNMVALSADGVYLVAANESLYLYTRSGPGWGKPSVLPPPQDNDYYVAAAISADGSWIAACTAASVILLIPNNLGVLGTPAALAMPNATIHNVAIAAGGSAFAAAGTHFDAQANVKSGYVYLFDTSVSSASPTLQPLWSSPLPNCANCRAIAIRDDGAFLSAVGTLTNPTAQSSGGVSVFKNVGGTGAVMWSALTNRDPNSTSMDALGDYVTVADGYPDATPSQPSPGYFYLYGAYDGAPVWSYQTDNMCWPSVISAKGNALVGGSDNGYVYSFSVNPSARSGD